jgi:hypothetical protein
VEPTNFIYGESPTINSISEPDFKLYLDGGIETVFLHQSMRKKIFLNVEKNISSPVFGGEVQLSGPPHVDIIIQSRKIRANKKRNVVFFTISANELGVFTLTATLTSDAGHQIEFPFKIRVEPTNYNYGEEPVARSATYSTPTSSTSDGLVAARIIFGIIGIILIFAGINIMSGIAWSSDNFTFGITLLIIGTIILLITSKGECCSDSCC